MAVYYTGGGGGFLGGLGKVLGAVGSFIPGMQWMAPVAAGMGAVDAASRGDIGGAAENAMGAYKGMQGNNAASVQNIAQPQDSMMWHDPSQDPWADFYARNKRGGWV